MRERFIHREVSLIDNRPPMASDPEVVLELQNLQVAYRMADCWIDVVRGVSLDIRRGETYGLVGESGCGKSTLAYAVMSHLGSNGRISGGRVLFLGADLQTLSAGEMHSLRGERISMIYQDPQTALNPALKVGHQIAEVVQTHEGRDSTEAWERATTMLESVHMPDPEGVMQRYAHHLSGGMQQRVLIAMALITNPDLLIMDEPTTGLDVTTEATVLDLVNELKERYDSAILYISHDLGVIANVCDRMGVMYAGHLVEEDRVEAIFSQPHHPYTLDLLRCVPRLDRGHKQLQAIPGSVPQPSRMPLGCVYEARCRFARDRCCTEEPQLTADKGGHRVRCFFWEEVASEELEPRAPSIHFNHAGLERIYEEIQRQSRSGDGRGKPLLSVRRLKKYFDQDQKSILSFGPRKPTLKAVDGISLSINEGETVSIVGESGCGKTTLGRCVVGLIQVTSGDIRFRNQDASRLAAQRPQQMRKNIQIVFQNPEATLNPRHKVGQILDRAIYLFGVTDRVERRKRGIELLQAVNLDPSFWNRLPSHLSGGEKQRVAIARAFAGSPKLVVCDEAVSSLDVSVQASILNLLQTLKLEQDCAYLFISHDLSVVRYISDKVAVMYLGQLMEVGSVEHIFTPPHHPYTQVLLSAVQVPDPGAVRDPILLEGPVPSPVDPPSGCPFHTRCPRKLGEVCGREPLPLQEGDENYSLYCHIPLDEL